MLIEITDEASILFAIAMYIYSSNEYRSLTTDEAIEHFKTQITPEKIEKATQQREDEKR